MSSEPKSSVQKFNNFRTTVHGNIVVDKESIFTEEVAEGTTQEQPAESSLSQMMKGLRHAVRHDSLHSKPTK
jgi:hypothetical protein